MHVVMLDEMQHVSQDVWTIAIAKVEREMEEIQ
jgi:hypothetical protein